MEVASVAAPLRNPTTAAMPGLESKKGQDPSVVSAPETMPSQAIPEMKVERGALAVFVGDTRATQE
jgi:hypothetical protein